MHKQFNTVIVCDVWILQAITSDSFSGAQLWNRCKELQGIYANIFQWVVGYPSMEYYVYLSCQQEYKQQQQKKGILLFLPAGE